MADVKPGDELMVVNFRDDVDPLHESLRQRIDEGQVEDPWDEDDGDGDVPAVIKR